MGKYAPSDPNHVFPNRVPSPECAARAQARHTVEPRTGCWISTYAQNASTGYAAVGWSEGGKPYTMPAHRASYIHTYGPIPDGMVIDHICHNRVCVNPKHLRAIPRGENARRQGFGDFPLGQCRNGHPLSEMRKRIKGVSAGMSYCGACQKERNDILIAKRRAESVAKRESKDHAD